MTATVPLPASELPFLLSSDNNLFPSPLTLEQLKSWHKTCPLLFRHSPTPSGGIIVALPLPLSTWTLLTSGILKEHELHPHHLSTRTSEPVALHVYHIERHKVPPPPSPSADSWIAIAPQRTRRDQHWIPVESERNDDWVQVERNEVWVEKPQRGGFTGFMLEEIKKAATEEMRLNVVGWSALVVTTDGMRAFRHRLGWEESEQWRGQVALKDCGVIETRDWNGKGVVVGCTKMLVKKGGNWWNTERLEPGNPVGKVAGNGEKREKVVHGEDLGDLTEESGSDDSSVGPRKGGRKTYSAILGRDLADGKAPTRKIKGHQF